MPQGRELHPSPLPAPRGPHPAPPRAKENSHLLGDTLTPAGAQGQAAGARGWLFSCFYLGGGGWEGSEEVFGESIIPFHCRGKKTSLKCTYPGDAEGQTHSSSCPENALMKCDLEKGMIFFLEVAEQPGAFDATVVQF